jgi:DNA (cytosine-5)-methyltransferase 1
VPDIDWRWCAEIDPFASAVHAARFPGVPNLGDVNAIDPDAVEPVDLVVFGSPCQSFSVAGRRLGLDDPRGNLALVALRLVSLIRPRWLVFENVPGLLSSDGGRDFGAFLGLLGECGYGWAYRVLDAQHFGCPFPRPRVFVIGFLGDWRPPAAVFFDEACLAGNCSPVEEQQKIASAPVLTAKGAMAFDDRTPCVLELWGVRRTTPIEWERALGFMDGYTDIPEATYRAERKARAEPVNALRADGSGLRRADGEAEPNVRAVWRINAETRRGSLPSDRQGAGHHLPFMQHQAAGSRRYGLGDAGVGVLGGRERRVADGNRYRALGNSMAVPVVRWILGRIKICQRLK